MATVYLAEQVSLSRLVAIKVLNANLCKDEAYVSRFQQEAKAAASLAHANIAQIYEVGVHEGRHYLSQEYLAGGTLGRQLDKQGRFDPDVALEVMRQVASALEAAADRGIVHRDIKPDNLLLNRSGTVKVADFGLARSTDSSAPSLTQEGVTLGTPLYMSPEQIEGREVDCRTDLYSLGATIYHLLAGQPPFAGDTAMSVAAQHLREQVPPIDEQVSSISKPFAEIIHRLLRKKPDDRISSPSELLSMLNGSPVEGSQVPVTGSQGVVVGRDLELNHLQQAMESASRSGQKKSGNLLPSWLLKVALLLILGGLAGAIFRPSALLSARNQVNVKREEDVTMQLYRAKVLDTSQAWNAVEQYFPDADEYYLLLAQRGLAERLFAKENYSLAIRPLNRLIAREDEFPDLGLIGKAGLVIAYTKLGEESKAERARGRLPVEESSRQDLRQIAPSMYDLLIQVEQDSFTPNS